MLKYSKRSSQLSASQLQQSFEKAKQLQDQGQIDIISLAVGEPYYPTPERIKQAAIEAIRNNYTKYTPASGSLDLKSKLAQKYSCLPDQVVISHGAKIILSSLLWTLVDHEDQVLISAPYYSPYVEVARSCSGKVILVDTVDHDFQLTAKAIEEKIVSQNLKPKILIINSPNNPTGAVYAQAELEKIADLSKRYGFIIIADECYRNFSTNPDFTFRLIDKKAIIVDSCSKTYAMTGWRLGWAICCEELAQRLNRYFGAYIGSNFSVAEKAAIQALGQPGIDDFIKQRQIIFAWLKVSKIPHVETEGAFYAFADFSKTMKTTGMNGSVKLAEYFLRQAKVALSPGIAFGDFDNYLRISYSVEVETLQEALARIEKIL